MNKVITTLFAVALLIGISTPSYADNSEEVAIGILGGVIGGLVLGEVLERPREYHNPVRVYEYDDYEPYMVQRCRTKFVRYYDSMGNLTRRAVKKCYWVERY
jgi:hypothetical protein